MQKFLLCFLSVIVVSSITFAQMKFQLPADIDGEDMISVNNSVLIKSETNSISVLPTELPADATDFIPGSLMIGLLGDVTFPFGEEFKNYAGTGWSVHTFGGYSVLNSLILTAKVGYIKFGEVETDYGLLKKGSAINEGSAQSNNQWVISLGGQYLPVLDPSCLSCLGTVNEGGFKPFIGLSLCLIFKIYIYKLLDVQGFYKLENITQAGETFEENSTIFGISPSVGTYFSVSENVRLIINLEYSYLFEEADVGASNINYLSINFGGAYSLW